MISQSFETSLKFWKDLSVPTFPILFIEAINGKEIRGFIKPEQVVGDIDFICYPDAKNGILIDSLGQMIDLQFNDIIIPGKVVEILSKENLYKILTPALIYQSDISAQEMIHSNVEIATFVEYLADKYCW